MGIIRPRVIANMNGILQQNAKRMPSRQTVVRILSLVLVIALSIYIYSIRDDARELAVYGYPGIFLFSLLTNATLLLPAPGIALVFAMGAVFDPTGVALAAGLGATVGELSGYLAGFSGQVVVERADTYDRVTRWMEMHRGRSYLTVFVLAFLPNPFFDIAGFVAGALRIPIVGFLISVLVGKTLKMLLLAYAGAGMLPILP